MNVGAVFSRRWIATTLVVLAGGAACVRLGIWQLDRLAQRQEFNRHVTEMESMPPVVLPTDADLTSQEYRSIQVKGQYDFAHQVALRNQVYDGQYGFHLITPLRLATSSTAANNPGTAILVDRGWIPATSNEDPAGWHKYDSVGNVHVQGVIRNAQTPPVWMGPGSSRSAAAADRDDFWMYVNPEEMGHQLPYPILPVYVQLESSNSASSLPIASPPPLDLSEGPHRGYALQWFSFACMLAVGYPIYVGKKETSKE